jgi:hypothetical protein
MLFEVLVLGGLGAMVVLLVRFGKTLETILSTCERWHLEATAHDYMPTLWIDPEFSHDNLITWFVLATGPNSQSLREWHWAALESNLAKRGESRGCEVSPDEIERLKNLSSEFFREAESSNLLTELEIRYLLFYAWNLYLHQGDPCVFVPDDVARFEGGLSDMRQRFFTQKRSR